MYQSWHLEISITNSKFTTFTGCVASLRKKEYYITFNILLISLSKCYANQANVTCVPCVSKIFLVARFREAFGAGGIRSAVVHEVHTLYTIVLHKLKNPNEGYMKYKPNMKRRKSARKASDIPHLTINEKIILEAV